MSIETISRLSNHQPKNLNYLSSLLSSAWSRVLIVSVPLVLLWVLTAWSLSWLN